ncbi:MAG: hypothetical protein IJ849_10220 [Selenomonadaceae bacterium]|nr:hypothetical protein [Selenomonadaceae bacterium]
MEVWIRSVNIAAYLPGRVRLYADKLVNNPALAQDIRARFAAYPEIEAVELSLATGSILIKYRPEVLRQNSELKKIEEYIMTHAKRRN